MWSKTQLLLRLTVSKTFLAWPLVCFHYILPGWLYYMPWFDFSLAKLRPPKILQTWSPRLSGLCLEWQNGSQPHFIFGDPRCCLVRASLVPPGAEEGKVRKQRNSPALGDGGAAARCVRKSPSAFPKIKHPPASDAQGPHCALGLRNPLGHPQVTAIPPLEYATSLAKHWFEVPGEQLIWLEQQMPPQTPPLFCFTPNPSGATTATPKIPPSFDAPQAARGISAAVWDYFVMDKESTAFPFRLLQSWEQLWGSKEHARSRRHPQLRSYWVALKFNFSIKKKHNTHKNSPRESYFSFLFH